MNQNNQKLFVDYLLCDTTQVRTVVKIAYELDVGLMVLFKSILLSKEHKLQLLKQMKHTLLDGDLVEDVCRHYQAHIVSRSETLS